MPEFVKVNIIDFTDVRLKTGEYAIRVTLNKLLSEKEKNEMQLPQIVGVECVAHYRYAPEIKHSYFYIKI